MCGRLDGRLVLIWPMMEDSRVLRMLSSETLEYRDIIVEPSEHAQRWVEDAWSHVLATTRASSYIFQNLRLPNALAAKLAQLPNAKLIGGGWCPLVRLDRFADWDAYASTLPKSLVADQRRQWRRVRQALPAVSFSLVDSVDVIEPVMDWISRHKVAGVRCGATGGLVQRRGYPRPAQVRCEVRSGWQPARACHAVGWGRNDLCWLGLRLRQRIPLSRVHYDTAYATYSPSRLFLEDILRYCFRNGIRTFDFMPGEEAYKRVWATDYVRQDSYIGPLNWRGELLLRFSKTKFYGVPVVLRDLYRMLPVSWRNAVQRRLRAYRLVNHALNLKPAPRPRPISAGPQA